MAVLITGATGTIGRVLTRGLADAGLDVTVLTRRPHRAHEAFGDKVKTYEWHPINQAVPPQALEAITCIVHLMGDEIAGKPTPHKLDRLSASRVTSTRRLIEASVASRSASDMRLIMASSAAIYPRRGAVKTSDTTAAAPEVQPKSTTSGPGICEDAANTVDPANKLASAIAQWEAAADPLRDLGGSVACVRLGQVISKTGFPRHLVDLFERRQLVQIPPETVIPTITLEDAAALFAWLVLNRKIVGPVNGVAPIALTGKAIMDVLTKREDDRISVTLPAWMSMRALGLLANQTLGNCHVTPKKLLNAGFSFSHSDPLEALRSAVTAQRSDISRQKATAQPPWLRRRSGKNTKLGDKTGGGTDTTTEVGKATKAGKHEPVLQTDGRVDGQSSG